MEEDLRSERYRLLVRTVGDVRQHAHGWKTEAAHLLGVSASYVSRVAGGRPYKIGRHALEAAVQRIPGLTLDWFTAESPDVARLQEMVAAALRADRRTPVTLDLDAESIPDLNVVVSYPIVKGAEARNEWERVRTLAEMVMRHAERGEIGRELDSLARAMVDGVRSLRLVKLTDELEQAEQPEERERALMLLALHGRLIAYAVLAASDPTATQA